MENQAELTKTRDAELTQAIEKIVRQRELKGDKIVFKNNEDFMFFLQKIRFVLILIICFI